MSAAPAESWAREFDGGVGEKLAARDFVGVQSWTRAPHARLAYPTAEHLLPLFFVLGAALPEDRVPPEFEGFHSATLSMRSFALRG
jgi:4,5-DOPA dioxygenase extradiol